MATIASDLAAGQIAMVGEARHTYEHKAVFTNTVSRYTLKDGEKSIYIPKFGTINATDLTDGEDMTDDQQLVITGTTHTTDEAGCKVIITKKLRKQLKADAYEAAGRVIGSAMGRKMDTDGLTLFSSLTGGLGAAGTIFTPGYWAAAAAQLMGQAEPVPEPYALLIHPYTLSPIVDYFTPLTNETQNLPPEFQSKILKNYWRGSDKLYRVPLFVDGNITINSADDAFGAMYSRDCFIYIVGWEPENWVEYDNSMRGWEIGVVADYAMVEEDDSYGRYMFFDASVPVS